MFDFHSHVLPGIDDGAASVDDSIALIQRLKSQHITDLVLTPHFYPDRQSADQFLSDRNHSYARLLSALDGSESIRFYLGAEVYCSEYLLVAQDLNPLCIEGTRLLLLEMPFSGSWSSDVWRVIEKLLEKHAIIPVIAHAERYQAVQRHPAKILNRLVDSGCVIQANCDSLLSPSLRGEVLKWLDHGLIHLLGTDCHNVEKRPPMMEDACRVIVRELGESALGRLEANGARLLSGKPLHGRDLFF